MIQRVMYFSVQVKNYHFQLGNPFKIPALVHHPKIGRQGFSSVNFRRRRPTNNSKILKNNNKQMQRTT